MPMTYITPQVLAAQTKVNRPKTYLSRSVLFLVLLGLLAPAVPYAEGATHQSTRAKVQRKPAVSRTAHYSAAASRARRARLAKARVARLFRDTPIPRFK